MTHPQTTNNIWARFRCVIWCWYIDQWMSLSYLIITLRMVFEYDFYAQRSFLLMPFPAVCGVGRIINRCVHRTASYHIMYSIWVWFSCIARMSSDSWKMTYKDKASYGYFSLQCAMLVESSVGLCIVLLRTEWRRIV